MEQGQYPPQCDTTGAWPDYTKLMAPRKVERIKGVVGMRCVIE